jgi:hypothetical protein
MIQDYSLPAGYAKSSVAPCQRLPKSRTAGMAVTEWLELSFSPCLHQRENNDQLLAVPCDSSLLTPTDCVTTMNGRCRRELITMGQNHTKAYAPICVGRKAVAHRHTDSCERIATLPLALNPEPQLVCRNRSATPTFPSTAWVQNVRYQL